jgi:hypothetical protein
MKMTLVDLPGAEKPGSYWEVFYQLHFIPEEEFWKTVRESQGVGQTISGPAQFRRTILLADGKSGKTLLATPTARIHVKKRIAFKSRIPEKERTKFARLMTSYSVKIYDAQLKLPLYHTGFFLAHPFVDDPARPENAVPRTTAYTNFFVSRKGELFLSQSPRNDDNDRTWHVP